MAILDRHRHSEWCRRNQNHLSVRTSFANCVYAFYFPLLCAPPIQAVCECYCTVSTPTHRKSPIPWSNIYNYIDYNFMTATGSGWWWWRFSDVCSMTFTGLTHVEWAQWKYECRRSPPLAIRSEWLRCAHRIFVGCYYCDYQYYSIWLCLCALCLWILFRFVSAAK